MHLHNALFIISLKMHRIFRIASKQYACLSVCLPAYVICFGTKICDENNQIHFLLNALASPTKCEINDSFEFDAIWNGWEQRKKQNIQMSLIPVQWVPVDMHICSFNWLTVCVQCAWFVSVFYSIHSTFSRYSAPYLRSAIRHRLLFLFTCFKLFGHLL